MDFISTHLTTEYLVILQKKKKKWMFTGTMCCIGSKTEKNVGLFLKPKFLQMFLQFFYNITKHRGPDHKKNMAALLIKAGERCYQ